MDQAERRPTLVAVLLMGTSNWGQEYFLNSRNVEVVLKRPDIARVLDEIFISLWKGLYIQRLDPEKEYQALRIN